MTKDVDNWFYSDEVKGHFLSPKNFLAHEPKEGEFDFDGEVGSVACGDVMKVWVKLDDSKQKIKDFKWQTWGCASAIAATSVFSEMLLENGGMTLEDALKIKPQEIVARLNGLPPRKIHCSVLVDQAFKKAVENYHQSR